MDLVPAAQLEDGVGRPLDQQLLADVGVRGAVQAAELDAGAVEEGREALLLLGGAVRAEDEADQPRVAKVVLQAEAEPWRRNISKLTNSD